MSRQHHISAKAESKPTATSTRYRLLQSSWGDRDSSQPSQPAAAPPILHEALNLPVHSPGNLVIQPKLTIGAVGDKYEQEADRVASEVVDRIHRPVVESAGASQPAQRRDNEAKEVQRKRSPDTIQQYEDEEELPKKPIAERIQRVGTEDKELQREVAIGPQATASGGFASPDLESSIQQARGRGQHIAEHVRTPLEQAFGADFSGVRVHTDAMSDQLNRSIQAKAFTIGQDVFFREGAYDPGSRGGKELLAHELTHAIQQKPRASIRIQRYEDKDLQEAAYYIWEKRRNRQQDKEDKERDWYQADQELKQGYTEAKVEEEVEQGMGEEATIRQRLANKQVLKPEADFNGRSYTEYGIGEEIDLNFNPFRLYQGKGRESIKWRSEMGKGTISCNSNSYRYTAKATGKEELACFNTNDTNNEQELTRAKFDVVEPKGGQMRRKPGTNLWHPKGYWGIGFVSELKLLPENVSFNNLVIAEGKCTAIVEGSLIDLFDKEFDPVHKPGKDSEVAKPDFESWGPNFVKCNDYVESGTTKQVPVGNGNYIWKIPFSYRMKKENAWTKMLWEGIHKVEAKDGGPTATIEKMGAGPFAAKVEDAHTWYFDANVVKAKLKERDVKLDEMSNEYIGLLPNYMLRTIWVTATSSQDLGTAEGLINFAMEDTKDQITAEDVITIMSTAGGGNNKVTEEIRNRIKSMGTNGWLYILRVENVEYWWDEECLKKLMDAAETE